MTDASVGLVLAVVSALVDLGPDEELSLREGCVVDARGRVRATTPPPPLSAARARVEVLLDAIGLTDAPVEYLAMLWKGALSTGSCSRASLLETGRHATLDKQALVPVERWRGRFNARMIRHLETLSAREWFGPELSPADRDGVLELGPLLAAWPQTLLEHPSWRFAAAPVPGLPQFPLDDVWVQVELGQNGVSGRCGPNRTVPIEELLVRLKSVALVLGRPGAGKTTMLKWLARHMIHSASGRFLLPLYVPLRRYAISRNPSETLLGFALRVAGVRSPEQRSLWTNLLSYISTTQRDTVLILLDGWDEVPSARRTDIAAEIETLAWGFACVITSRVTSHLNTLPVDSTWVLSELSEATSLRLMRRWCAAAERSELVPEMRRHLRKHPDLRSLARNPFALTLLCGVASLQAQLPDTRSALYRDVIARIFVERSAREPPWSFNRNTRRDVCSLALWLLAETPDAPRYVFDAADVIDSGGRPELLSVGLEPSRLVARVHEDRAHFQFLHASFQEFLAAGRFTEGDPAAMRRWLEVASPSGLREVLRFVAGLGGSEPFWAWVRDLLGRPDPHGVTALAASSWVAEAGDADGGRDRLGVDLRDRLWVLLGRTSHLDVFVDAFLALDPADLVRRCRAAVGREAGDTTDRWHMVWARSNDPLWIERYVDELLSGESTPPPPDLTLEGAIYQRLRDALVNDTTARFVRSRVINLLAATRESRIIPTLFDLIRHTPDGEVRDAAIDALARIGDADALDVLIDIASGPAHAGRARAIQALGESETSAGRRWLLRNLAGCDADSSTLRPILEALPRVPLRREAVIVMAWLSAHGDAAVRAAAAAALTASTHPATAEALAQAARTDPDPAVRAHALTAFVDHARPVDAAWLCRLARDTTGPADHRAAAARAMLSATERFAHRQDGPLLRTNSVRLVDDLWDDAEVVDTLVDAVWVLGDTFAPRLEALARRDDLKRPRRVTAIDALGRIGATNSAPLLADLLEEWGEQATDHAVAVANALARVAPARLDEIDNPAARVVQARIAIDAYLFGETRLRDRADEQLGLPAAALPEVDVEHGVVAVGESTAHLTPRSAEVLAQLLASAGLVVSHREIGSIGDRGHVGFEARSRQRIVTLRKQLRDGGMSHVASAIVAVSGKGFRFVWV